MPAITTTYKENLSLGSRDGVVAKAAGADNGDTFVTGLSVIEHAEITNGASGAVGGYTASGGTLTLVLSASFANLSILAVGYK